MESQHTLRTLQKKRTSNFREDETKLLIQLWGSPQIQNKLYLTHRKAPVMRVLAANMQRHGFYRTPDEIKTRIRNLKCLYHRIKRTVKSGTGLGTVDPDWPHYKVMDAILSKENTKKENLYKDNVLEGPRCEDIKQEVEDIEINDDMESYTTSSNHGSDYGENMNPLPSLTPAPSKEEKSTGRAPAQTNNVPIMPGLTNFAIPMQTQQVTSPQNGINTRPGGLQSLPFPLLIVQQKPPGNDKKSPTTMTNMTGLQALQHIPQHSQLGPTFGGESNILLKEILEIQKENLALEKERLGLEKEKLEYQKAVGNQILTLIPIFGSLLQKIAYSNSDTLNVDIPPQKNGKKRKSANDDILRESKILRTVLEKNIKKYMLGDDYEDSDKDDSGIEIKSEEPKKEK